MLMRPDVIFKEKQANDMSKMRDKMNHKKDSLKTDIDVFLAKKNPGKPPESLRLHKNLQFKETEPVIARKYGNVDEANEDGNALNPSTAPPLKIFSDRPWYYQGKESWRYLRVKDPEPLPVERILENIARK